MQHSPTSCWLQLAQREVSEASTAGMVTQAQLTLWLPALRQKWLSVVEPREAQAGVWEAEGSQCRRHPG